MVIFHPQYLVFEYVEKNLLEVLEEHPGGLELEQVRHIEVRCHSICLVHKNCGIEAYSDAADAA